MIRLGKHLVVVKMNGAYVTRCAVCRQSVSPDHVPGTVTVNGPTCG